MNFLLYTVYEFIPSLDAVKWLPLAWDYQVVIAQDQEDLEYMAIKLVGRYEK